MRLFHFVRNSLIATALVTMTLVPTAARAGSLTFDVVINTSSFQGQSGDVEFQLGGDGNSIPVTVSFDNFSSDAMLNGLTANLNPGGVPNVTVTGDLSTNTLSLDNDDSAFQVADADQLVSHFGTTFDFHVTLTGDGIGAASPGTATLAISMFDSFNNPLCNGPVDTNNAAVFFQTSSTDGSVTQTNFQVNTVPEPSSLASMLVGGFGIGLGIYFRRSLAI